MRTLNSLFEGLAALPRNAALLEDLTLDSRAVRPGTLFIALGGRRTHGLEFGVDAVARGASVVLWEPGAQATLDLEHAVRAAAAAAGAFAAPVTGLRAVLGRIADRFFGEPSANMRIVGITGTNGKTTTAYLLAQCLTRLGRDAAYIGTIGWGRIGALETPTHTTPDVVSLHRQLAALRAQGVGDVALEVSSHALDQGRVDGVRFHVAAFTNLSRDHLDYHASMEAYGAAKARLFSFPELRSLVINVGDRFGREAATRYSGAAPLTAVWVDAALPESPQAVADAIAIAGAARGAARTLHVTQVTVDLRGLSLMLDGTCGAAALTTRLIGRFNAENSVIVLACLSSLGASLASASAALAECEPPPGRMEVVARSLPGKPLAVIDYAHTPDALAKALQALREHCGGALWCVFGCGGDRDPGKRPLMGAAADRLADCIIVTDDNPRSEDPAAITAGILRGVSTGRARVIHDRSAAIAAAVDGAREIDAVLIAGKGHEDYQIYGDSRRSFSDRRETLRHLGVAA